MPESPPHKLHISIIPDGNRRWAELHGLLPWKGHEQAVENIREVTEWCARRADVGTLTLWCMARANFLRAKPEVSALKALLWDYLRQEEPTFHDHNIRFLHAGRRENLNQQTLRLIDKISRDTRNNAALTLQLLIDYDGEDDIERAIERRNADPNGKGKPLRDYVDNAFLPDIDIVIRTGFAQRTSKFCMLQAGNAELFFPRLYFPDFHRRHIQHIVDHKFPERQRRFGK
jgi:undecaprenyl diphosphate synthase